MNYTYIRTSRPRVDDAKLKELWPSPMPNWQLTNVMGHHLSTLRRRAKQLGLVLPRKLAQRSRQEAA